MEVRVCVEGADDVLVEVPVSCTPRELRNVVTGAVALDPDGEWECVVDGAALFGSDAEEGDGSNDEVLWAINTVVEIRPTCRHVARERLRASKVAHTASSLSDALDRGDAATIRYLVDADVLPHGTVGDELRRACALGDRPRAALLLSVSAEVDASDDHGVTPLMKAAAHGDTTLCELLLAHGASVNAVTQGGYTALITAAEHGCVAVCNLFLEHHAEVSPQTKRFGWTALMFAAMSGKERLCRALVAAGADVNARRNDGATALMLAASRGCHALCEYFISHGADGNAFVMLL